MNSVSDNGAIQVEETSKIEETSIIVTKNVEDLIPIREDVGTTWRISNSGITLSDYSAWEGITEVAGKRYRAGGSFDLQEITVNVFKFDTPDKWKVLAKIFLNFLLREIHTGSVVARRLFERDLALTFSFELLHGTKATIDDIFVSEFV